MSIKVEKYLKYPPNRDLLVVLGAGASRPDGVPLQKDILPQIISGGITEIQNSEIGKVVIDFIKDNFSFDLQNNMYPQLEAVFGFMDYFIQQNESLNAKYSCEKITHIKEFLIKLIHYIVNLETNKSSNYYNRFWKALVNNVPNSAIITLNYDTLLEQSFDFLFKNHGYIDYCIPLMNYVKQPELTKFNFWVNSREPILVDLDENPLPFKIIKLHGSLNWKYCNCCNQILLTPWDRKIDLERGKFLGYTYPEKEEYEFLCPLDGTEFQTLIMPPSYLKTLHHPAITQLINEAAREIRIAKKVIFIGYSLSNSDIHIKALFKKQMKTDMEVIVINPKRRESMELNYRSLTKNVTFLYISFEEMLQDESLINSLFAKKVN
jgi:NAD-dependent SIR2 family protein deacetylase